ncbi:MAG: outer membrane protein assembly factor BamE [Chromatocurvus sp.]
MRVLTISLLLITLSACGVIGFPGVYKINVEQGNIITQEDVDKLEQGMTRRQVRFILGTPLIEDTFNRDRWDYHYKLKRGDEVLSEREFTVFFDGDRLESVEGDYETSWARDNGQNSTDGPAGGAAARAMPSTVGPSA